MRAGQPLQKNKKPCELQQDKSNVYKEKRQKGI